MAQHGWKQLLDGGRLASRARQISDHRLFRIHAAAAAGAQALRPGRQPDVSRRRSLRLARHRISSSSFELKPGWRANRLPVDHGAGPSGPRRAGARHRQAEAARTIPTGPRGRWPRRASVTSSCRRWRFRKTQDDKGRVRWTLFGASEQGPAKAFWRGFFTAPREEWPVERSLDFIRRLLVAAYGEDPAQLADLRRAGFRVMAQTTHVRQCRIGTSIACPTGPSRSFGSRAANSTGVKYLLTFEPLATSAGGGPQGLSGRRAAPAAVSRQFAVLGQPGLSASWPRSCRWPCRFRCCTRSSGTRARSAFACRSRAGCTSHGRAKPRSKACAGRCATRSCARIAGAASIATKTN